MAWFHALEKKLKTKDSLEKRDWVGTTSVLALVGHHRARNQLEILLTKRTMHVETHKGQISFPGGYYEQIDVDLLQTALRETEEEIGLTRDRITVLGRLEPVHTRNSILIFPWVGTVDFPVDFRVNPNEVEQIIYFPVTQLFQPGLKSIQVEVSGRHIPTLGITYEGHLIWGATAMMLQELARHLGTEAGDISEPK